MEKSIKQKIKEKYEGNSKLQAVDKIEDEFDGFIIWCHHLRDKLTYNEYVDLERRFKALENNVMNKMEIFFEETKK